MLCLEKLNQKIKFDHALPVFFIFNKKNLEKYNFNTVIKNDKYEE